MNRTFGKIRDASRLIDGYFPQVSAFGTGFSAADISKKVKVVFMDLTSSITDLRDLAAEPQRSSAVIKNLMDSLRETSIEINSMFGIKTQIDSAETELDKEEAIVPETSPSPAPSSPAAPSAPSAFSDDNTSENPADVERYWKELQNAADTDKDALIPNSRMLSPHNSLTSEIALYLNNHKEFFRYRASEGSALQPIITAILAPPPKAVRISDDTDARGDIWNRILIELPNDHRKDMTWIALRTPEDLKKVVFSAPVTEHRLQEQITKLLTPMIREQIRGKNG
jgi:hypothetical protein